MKAIEEFISSIQADCGTSLFTEAVSSAARALFEADDEETADTSDTASADGDENDTTADGDEPDTTADGDENDATADGTSNADEAATVDTEPANGDETPNKVNMTPEPAMSPEEIVKKFVASGAVRKAQEDMVQTKNDSLEEFAKKIAASLAKFCVDNQIPTLDPDGAGKDISIALAKRFGQAK